MDFDRIIIKENKNTVDTITRLEFNLWTAMHNVYCGPPDIKSYATYKRENKIRFFDELDGIIYKKNLR
jgi:hypothetical protein